MGRVGRKRLVDLAERCHQNRVAVARSWFRSVAISYSEGSKILEEKFYSQIINVWKRC